MPIYLLCLIKNKKCNIRFAGAAHNRTMSMAHILEPFSATRKTIRITFASNLLA